MAKVAGILGGMGPQATVDLLQRIINNTPARDDSDHIRVLIDNNPKVPSRIDALIHETGPSPLPELIDMAQQLEKRGADFLAMPCNTAHHYYPALSAAVGIPFLNIVEESLEHVAHQVGGKLTIALLASSALPKIRLFEPVAQRLGAHLLYPHASDQRDVMQLIKDIKAGAGSTGQIENLGSVIQRLEGRGAHCVLIACTELSVVAGQLNATLPVYDAAEILASAVVRTACH